MAKTKQCTWNGGLWGIANAHGDPWTRKVFDSIPAARDYLNAQAQSNPNLSLSKHSIVPVSVTIRVLAAKKK